MTMRRLIPTLALAVAVGAALSGCISNPGADPPPTIATASGYTPATHPVPRPPTQPPRNDWTGRTPKTSGASSTPYCSRSSRCPPDQVEPAIAAVAVDPIASRLARRPTPSSGRSTRPAIGPVISSISWPQPINGADTAVLMDCQDGSQAGILDTTTGNRLTVGTKNTSFRGTLVRTPAGWRVQNGELLEGATCTPAA